MAFPSILACFLYKLVFLRVMSEAWNFYFILFMCNIHFVKLLIIITQFAYQAVLWIYQEIFEDMKIFYLHISRKTR